MFLSQSYSIHVIFLDSGKIWVLKSHSQWLPAGSPGLGTASRRPKEREMGSVSLWGRYHCRPVLQATDWRPLCLILGQPRCCTGDHSLPGKGEKNKVRQVPQLRAFVPNIFFSGCSSLTGVQFNTYRYLNYNECILLFFPYDNDYPRSDSPRSWPWDRVLKLVVNLGGETRKQQEGMGVPGRKGEEARRGVGHWGPASGHAGYHASQPRGARQLEFYTTSLPLFCSEACFWAREPSGALGLPCVQEGSPEAQGAGFPESSFQRAGQVWVGSGGPCCCVLWPSRWLLMPMSHPHQEWWWAELWAPLQLVLGP